MYLKYDGSDFSTSSVGIVVYIVIGLLAHES